MIKLLTYISMIVLMISAISCSDDDSVHFIRLINGTADKKIDVTFGNYHFDTQANSEYYTSLASDYISLTPGVEYDVQYTIEQLKKEAIVDTFYTDYQYIYDPEIYVIDTVYYNGGFFLDTTWLVITDSIGVFNADTEIDTTWITTNEWETIEQSNFNTGNYDYLDNFNGEGRVYWDLKFYDYVDVYGNEFVIHSIDRNLPMN
ncbi:MAG: hypothetical protein JXR48_10675 [Candidatus Delongbacteria bacterium]|nr:hypothetical protein [Candidatus Delongbacteria bacterium]MBN2835416.1 hypothetical protein [Candidatus Delongbacteria bacterium]